MDKQSILNKYSKPEDKLLISKMLDKMKLAQTKNSIEYTDFLDLYEQKLLDKIIKQENIKLKDIFFMTADDSGNYEIVRKDNK